MAGPKKIYEKIVGNITYELKHWPNDNKYVIYKWDSNIKGLDVNRIPEVGTFATESDARAFLDKI